MFEGFNTPGVVHLIYASMAAQPIIAEFLRQVREEEYRLNLTLLWYAAWQPVRMKVKRWAKRNHIGFTPAILQHPGGPARADGITAVRYLLDLDRSLGSAYVEYLRFSESSRWSDRTVQQLMSNPTPLMAVLAICDAMVSLDSNLYHAVFMLRCELLVWAQHVEPDAIHVESLIARTQRAMLNQPHPLELFGIAE